MRNRAVIIPDDYKDIVYRFTYYLLAKVAHRIPQSISPNQLTYSAFSSAIIGCLLLFIIKSPVAFLYWALFNFFWYILDALDGIHARLTNQTSEFGAFLDHFLDNVFFIFMFSVFTIRFNLAEPLYIFIMLLRATAATSVFIVQVHTKRLYLGRFSGGLELILMTTTMFLSYAFPHFNLAHVTHNPFLLTVIDKLSLHQGVFMKLALLFYVVGVPLTFFYQIKFVKENSASDDPEAKAAASSN